MANKRDKNSNNIKSPSDYPMIGFRSFGIKHKGDIDRLVKELVRVRNRKSDRPVKKNEVMSEALIHGLEALIKKSKKSP